ncbi:RNA methyltransferase [Roseibium aquae]|uniref:RNA methyltransferase n=1 Tax=Roseibium aquae TaxID=1323746 RepID=A0A916TL14_9HYPH|nr:class I SAM-dependent RNA methyltransferase [Roseibium aquae]GGB51555.1 RNA methyltransferase [Roseibium aquae]
MDPLRLTIDHLGHRGDGVALADTGPIFVPGALPGETIDAAVDGDRARNVRILTPSPDRVAPVCRHFEACGGCAVQHLRKEAYDDWKRALVSKALSDRGIDHPVEPIVSGDPGTRRRAVFSAVRAGRHTVLGYHEKASHKLVDISECPVLDPAIVGALPDLKRLAGQLLPKKDEMRVTVLATTAGLDVTVEKADKSYDKTIPAVSRLAAEADWARLSVNGETLIEIRPPMLDMGGAALVPPPGGFTQATLEGEQALVAMVLKGAGTAKTVADLFSGSGTFALHLARQAKVHAVEGDAAALKAMDQAIRRAQGLKTLKTTRRDLFRSPLVREELAHFEAVVFDPPRTGAQAQAAQLAGSEVKTVIAVSCNPATLARDLRILIDGGYVLQTVTPVDQFVFSPHIEVVAVLTR